MFYTCVTRFDVMGNFENFLVFRVKPKREKPGSARQDRDRDYHAITSVVRSQARAQRIRSENEPPGHSHAAGQGSIDPRHTHAQGQPRTPPSRPGGEWRGHEPGAATAANQDLERPRRARAARRFPFSARGDTGASDSAASVSPAAADRRTCPFASVAGAPGGGHWIGICRDS